MNPNNPQETAAWDAHLTAHDAFDRLVAIASTPGPAQSQAISSLVGLGCCVAAALNRLHSETLSSKASVDAITANVVTRRKLRDDAKQRSEYPALVRTSQFGNTLPDWAWLRTLELFPEPLSPPSHALDPQRAELRTYMRAFAHDFDGPMDQFNAVEESDRDGMKRLSLAKMEGRSAFRKEFANQFRHWMERHFWEQVEDPNTPLGRRCAQQARANRKKGIGKSVWDELYQFAYAEARLLKVEEPNTQKQ